MYGRDSGMYVVKGAGRGADGRHYGSGKKKVERGQGGRTRSWFQVGEEWAGKTLVSHSRQRVVKLGLCRGDARMSCCTGAAVFRLCGCGISNERPWDLFAAAREEGSR